MAGFVRRISAAEDLLGISSRKQPDWFTNLLGHLQLLLALRNETYSKWVGTGVPADLVKFMKARGEARRAIRAVKISGFRRKQILLSKTSLVGSRCGIVFGICSMAEEVGSHL